MVCNRVVEVAASFGGLNLCEECWTPTVAVVQVICVEESWEVEEGVCELASVVEGRLKGIDEGDLGQELVVEGSVVEGSVGEGEE